MVQFPNVLTCFLIDKQHLQFYQTKLDEKSRVKTVVGIFFQEAAKALTFSLRLLILTKN